MSAFAVWHLGKFVECAAAAWSSSSMAKLGAMPDLAAPRERPPHPEKRSITVTMTLVYSILFKVSIENRSWDSDKLHL